MLHVYMTMAYVGKGMYREAVGEVQKSVGLAGTRPWEMTVLAHIELYEAWGRRGQAENYRRERASQSARR